MNNRILAGMILGGVVVTAVGAYASTRIDLNPWQDYAKVVGVEPAFTMKSVPHEVCSDEAIAQQVPVKDEKRIAGTAIGAVIGGVLGNQVGDGNGQKLATAAGAVAGGYAGSKVQKQMQDGNTETATEQRCETVYDSEKVPAGYQVTYLLGGQEYIVVMDHHPGNRIRLKDGELVLSQS